MDKIWCRIKKRVRNGKCRNKNKTQMSKEERLKKEYYAKCRALVFEISFYVVFLVLLIVSSYNNRDARAFEYRMNILNNIDAGKNFSKIKTPAQMWNWTQSSLVHFLDSDLSRRLEQNVSDRKLVSTLSSYKVGPTRFRQHRAKDGPCSFGIDLGNLTVHCSPLWSSADRDWVNYGARWNADLDSELTLGVNDSCASGNVSGTNNADPDGYNTSCAWMYKSWSDIGGLPITGNLGLYPPGGYVVDIVGSKEEVKEKLSHLQTNRWVDNRTRVVLIELTVYSANVNLFAMVTVMFEFSQAEVIIGNIHIHPFRLFVYLGHYKAAMLACDYLVYAAIVWFMFREINIIYEERFEYFKKFWNLLELANLLTSVSSIALHVGRQLITEKVSKEATKVTGHFYNFQTLAMWDEVFGFLLAFVSFMSILQMVHLLRFNKRMSILGDTIRRSAADLWSFSIVFVLTLFAFISFSYSIFGSFLKSYRTVIDSLEAILLIGLGHMEYELMMEVSRVFTPAFIMLYALFIVFLLLNLLVTILMDAFAEVREDVNTQSNDHELIDYIVSSVTTYLWNYSPFRVFWVVACKVGLVSHSEPTCKREDTTPSDKETSLPKKTKKQLQTNLTGDPDGCNQSLVIENLSLIHIKLDRISEEITCLLRREGFGPGIELAEIIDDKVENVNRTIEDNDNGDLNKPVDVYETSEEISLYESCNEDGDGTLNPETVTQNVNIDNKSYMFDNRRPIRKEKRRRMNSTLGDQDMVIEDMSSGGRDVNFNPLSSDQLVPDFSEIYTQDIYPNLNSRCAVVPDMRIETCKNVNRRNTFKVRVDVINELHKDNNGNSFPLV